LDAGGMSRLSAQMRETLAEAARNPLRRLHDQLEGKPPWPAHPATLRALEQRGLLNKSRRRTRKSWWLDEWAITDQGREALNPKPAKSRSDKPVYLARPSRSTGDYTYNRKYAIDDLEVIPPSSLDRKWAAQADIELADARNRKNAARHAARQARAA
jgi:hypothetical protein